MMKFNVIHPIKKLKVQKNLSSCCKKSQSRRPFVFSSGDDEMSSFDDDVGAVDDDAALF